MEEESNPLDGIRRLHAERYEKQKDKLLKTVEIYALLKSKHVLVERLGLNFSDPSAKRTLANICVSLPRWVRKMFPVKSGRVLSPCEPLSRMWITHPHTQERVGIDITVVHPDTFQVDDGATPLILSENDQRRLKRRLRGIQHSWYKKHMDDHNHLAKECTYIGEFHVMGPCDASDSTSLPGWSYTKVYTDIQEEHAHVNALRLMHFTYSSDPLFHPRHHTPSKVFSGIHLPQDVMEDIDDAFPSSPRPRQPDDDDYEPSDEEDDSDDDEDHESSDEEDDSMMTMEHVMRPLDPWMQQ